RRRPHGDDGGDVGDGGAGQGQREQRRRLAARRRAVGGLLPRRRRLHGDRVGGVRREVGHFAGGGAGGLMRMAPRLRLWPLVMTKGTRRSGGPGPSVPRTRKMCLPSAASAVKVPSAAVMGGSPSKVMAILPSGVGSPTANIAPASGLPSAVRTR